MSGDPDAIVVGAGPNGLTAAITLAQAGVSVTVYEAADTPGGGARTQELTLPGFLHDVCSAIHPLVLASPAFRRLPLERHGLQMVQPDAPLAHPLDGGRAAVLERGVQETANGLGVDEKAYASLMTPLVRTAEGIYAGVLAPLWPPRNPVPLIRFGPLALRSARAAARRFKGDQARALIAGTAAHSMLSLDSLLTGGYGVMLNLVGHTAGWPIPVGGSASIVNALVAYLEELGGKVVTGVGVQSIKELPPAQAVLLNLTPRQVLTVAGDRLPERYARALARFRYGPGVFKLDWALDGPVPWMAEGCRRAGTVHVGGTFDEIASSEDAVVRGKVPDKPYVLTAQQSLFDRRAPDGKHTLWGYCHVPSGCEVDMTERVESQIERFAPGFKERVLARSVKGPSRVEAYNANYVGGDINGGMQDIWQLWTRPVRRLVPYTTPDRSLYICSSSTPPGGGVHGMCGYFAAKAALRRSF